MGKLSSFGWYLNPIISYAGFNSNLMYMVKPLAYYGLTREYLNQYIEKISNGT